MASASFSMSSGSFISARGAQQTPRAKFSLSAGIVGEAVGAGVGAAACVDRVGIGVSDWVKKGERGGLGPCRQFV